MWSPQKGGLTVKTAVDSEEEKRLVPKNYLRTNNMKGCESWLQLFAQLTLLLQLLACCQCTSAREESCPQMNEVQNPLEKYYQCNATCGLMQLVKVQGLQTVINFTKCHLEGYIDQYQDAVARFSYATGDVQLLLNAHSMLDNILTTDWKKIKSFQGSVIDIQRLLSLDSHVVSRIQSGAKLIANSFGEITGLQQNLNALEHNLSQYNSEAESLILVMNATLLALDTFLPDCADSMEAVETLVLVASSAVTWARAAEREADHTYGAALLLVIYHDDIERSLTEISIVQDTANTSYTQRTVATMTNDFGRLLEVSDEIHGSLAELIKNIDSSLDDCTVTVNDRMYFEASTVLFAKIGSALAEYEAYEQEIVLHAARVAVVQQHVEVLIMQELSIARMAAAAGIPDLPDENDRLLAIQTIAGVALQVSTTAVNALNTTINQTGQEVTVSILELRCEEQLQLQITNFNASLTNLLLQLENRTVRLELTATTADGITNSLSTLNNQIRQTASKYWHTQNLVERLWREANATLEHLADLCVDQLNRIASSIGSVQNDTERIWQNTEEVAREFSNMTDMTVRQQLVGLNSSVLEVKNTTATLNQSLQDLADLFQDVSDRFTAAKGTTSIAFNFLDQVTFPLKFTNDTILTINPSMSEGMGPRSKELHNIALVMKADQTNDSVLLHYSQLWHSVNQNISLTIGLLEGNVYASFVYRHPEAGVDSVNLTIPDKSVEPFEQYSIEVTRTERNVHLFLVEVDSGEEYHVSGSASDRITFFLKSAFHQNVVVNIGGILNEDDDPEHSGTGNFSGCIGSISINGLHLSLWQMAPHMNAQPCTECLEDFINPLLLYFEGRRYAQTNASGNMFPLQLTFSTLLPNGLLMFARNEERSSSLQIGLRFGHVVIRVDTDSGHRTLTSSGIYHSGSRQAITVMLTPSMRGLMLRTRQEETVRGLRTITAEELGNYSLVLIGGVPLETELNIDVGNFTGCIRISSAVLFDPPLPSCITMTEQRECSYCSNEAVLSASFYGASYAEFPPFSIENDFDISFSFRTSSPNGLILYGGDVSEQSWIALVLIDSELHLIFGSSIGNVDLPARSPPLNNSQWHAAAIVKAGSSLYLFVNGTNAGSFPFGSFLPGGRLPSNLFIGGVDSADVLFPGVSREGFKGCLEEVYIMGRPLDFSENEKSQQIAYNTCTSTIGGEEDVYFFNESSFAEYDLGRFEPDFLVGFQLRTLVQTGLIFYLFSGRLDDVFAVQLVDGELQLYTANGTAGWVASSSRNVSNGLWHSVVAEKVGDTSRLIVDGAVGADASAPSILRTNSALYIGGLPSDRRVRLPSVITSQGYVGCLMTSYLSHSQLSNVLVNRCTIRGPNN